MTDERVRGHVPRDHPRPLQEPAELRARSRTPDAHAEGQNPLCGDEVTISVKFAADGETIEDIRFEGRGCAISQAATSMLTDIVKGKTAAEVARSRRRSCWRRSASR